MIDFGIYLRRQREEARLSLRELGERLGVSKQYLCSIEVGEAKPSMEICRGVARQLGLDSDVVLIMAGHMPEDVLAVLQENPLAGCSLLRQLSLREKEQGKREKVGGW